MKAKVPGVVGEAESSEIAADITILGQLSAAHVAEARIARELDALIATLAGQTHVVKQLAVDLEIGPKRVAPTGLLEDRTVRGSQPGTVDEMRGALDNPSADLDPSAVDLKLRLQTLVADQAAAEETARRLADGLSPASRRIYVSLSGARRLPLMVTLNGDYCGGCNVRLPSGLLAEIRRVRRLHRCPSCKRIVSSSTTEA